MALKIIKTIRVNPSTNSSNDDSAKTLMNLPLTFFDLLWLKFHPNQHVIFYKLADSSNESFHSLILPKLESSLSLVLSHYLLLAGRIIWDPQEPKPCMVLAKNDNVSLTVAETDADFAFLSGDGIRPAAGLHPLLSELTVSDDSASAISLQIPLFPNQGFCIGITSHHAVIDGKSATMFIKSWAHICMLQENNDQVVACPRLPDYLTPSFDRTVINIPRGLDEKMFELSMSFSDEKDNIKSMKLPPMGHTSPDVVRVTLHLNLEDIEKLRERVKKDLAPSLYDELHLSTFIIAYAYAWTCLVKMRGGDANRPVHFLYAADMRLRLNPPAPATYFGNCVFPQGSYEYEAGAFLEEEGFFRMVKILSDSVKGLGSQGIESIFEDYMKGLEKWRMGAQFGSVAGSTRLGVYGIDFGWGKPVKTEFVSIDRNEALSMSERRDEKGGVEMGVCLKKSEIDTFLSLFKNGLNG